MNPLICTKLMIFRQNIRGRVRYCYCLGELFLESSCPVGQTFDITYYKNKDQKISVCLKFAICTYTRLSFHLTLFPLLGTQGSEYCYLYNSVPNHECYLSHALSHFSLFVSEILSLTFHSIRVSSIFIHCAFFIK